MSLDLGIHRTRHRSFLGRLLIRTRWALRYLSRAEFERRREEREAREWMPNCYYLDY